MKQQTKNGSFCTKGETIVAKAIRPASAGLLFKAWLSKTGGKYIDNKSTIYFRI